MKRRVAVTGVGLITPVGIGKDATWSALLAGQSGVGPISHFDASDYAVRFAAEVEGFTATDWMSRQQARRFDRFIQLALATAKMTFADAGIEKPLEGEEALRAGTMIGSGIGGLPMIESTHATLLERGPAKVTPFFIPGVIVNLASGLVSIEWGLQGPNSATCTACSTGTHAIGEAFRLIQSGKADRMICGGAEAVICPLGVAGFAAMKALSTRNDDPQAASRPFDKDRDGFVIGEGCGLLMLEDLDTARERGARLYAEMLGYGMSADAYHVSAPHETGDGARRVMLNALEDSGLSSDTVDYVNAHGTSTPLGDRLETEAIHQAFGEHAKKLVVTSTKSMIGHLLGAAGGVEAVVTALSIAEGKLHPTINLDEPGEGCDLDYAPGDAREMPIRAALTNSFGFGGTNAALVLGKV
ncbi:MAG: beta-ketoacyl-ACP synthase II [Acidobacteriota bacterium]